MSDDLEQLREQLRRIREAKAKIAYFPHPKLLPYRRALLERDEQRVLTALKTRRITT